MFPRLFRRTKKQLTPIVALSYALSLFGVLLLGKTDVVFAQTASSGGQATVLDTLNDTYKDYLGLFAPNSTITWAGIKQSDARGNAEGMVFGINLVFDTTTNNAKWHWDHVTNRGADESDVFVINLCQVDGAKKCWLQTIPLSDKKTTTSTTGSFGISGGGTTTIQTGTEHAAYRIGTTGNYLNAQNFGFNSFLLDKGVATAYSHIYSYDPVTDVVTPSAGVVFGSGTSYTADLWYCAGSDGANAIKAYNKAVSNPSVRTFGAGTNSPTSLCGGTTYFKIASVATPIVIPADASTLGQSVAAGNSALDSGRTENSALTDLPSCSLSNVAWCFAHLVYYLIYKPIEWVAAIFGKLFDFFLGYSLSSSSYSANFITVGWKLVRDISNIFFIIILVWTGFSAVFALDGTGNIKKVLPALILNALLINFSLFGVQLLIDISNITARLFYNAMEVCVGPCDGTNFDRNFGYWALSEKIVSSFNPQKIFNPTVLNGLNAQKISSDTIASGSKNGSEAGDTKTGDTSSASYAGYYIVVSLIAAAIMFGILLMFWKVSFIFLGRVIGLYLVMMFSPFAFLSRGNLPLVGSIPMLSWKDWWKELSQYLTLAPLFVFFLYIIYSIISSDFIKNVVPNATTDQTGSFFETVIRIAVPMLIVYFLVDQAAKIAKDFSGKVGGQISGYLDKVAGIGSVAAATAVGVASGGVAAVGRGTLGRLGRGLANSSRLREWAGSDNWLARKAGQAGVGIGERAATSTFDARNTSALKSLGVTGKENTTITGALRVKTDNTKGGLEGSIDRKEKRAYAAMKVFQLSGDMKAAQDAKAEAWDKAHWDNPGGGLERWKNLQKATGTGLENNRAAIAKAKSNFVKTEGEGGNIKPKTGDEINRERNEAYGKRIAADAKVNKILGDIAAGGAGIGAAAGLTSTAGALAGIGGEFESGAVATGRVSQNIARLGAFGKQISELRGEISEIQEKIYRGTSSQGDGAKLKELQSLLRDAESKRDKLNERLTQK